VNKINISGTPLEIASKWLNGHLPGVTADDAMRAIKRNATAADRAQERARGKSQAQLQVVK
jgi:hypothetical protein